MNNSWLQWRYKGFINIRAKKVLNDLAIKGDLVAKGYLRKYTSSHPTNQTYLQINTLRNNGPTSLKKNNAKAMKPNDYEEIFITKRNCLPIKRDLIDYNKRIFSTERERRLYNSIPFFSLNKDALNWIFPMSQTEPNQTKAEKPKMIKSALHKMYFPKDKMPDIYSGQGKRIVTLDNHIDMSNIRKRMVDKFTNKQDNMESLFNSITVSAV